MLNPTLFYSIFIPHKLTITPFVIIGFHVLFPFIILSLFLLSNFIKNRPQYYYIYIHILYNILIAFYSNLFHYYVYTDLREFPKLQCSLIISSSIRL